MPDNDKAAPDRVAAKQDDKPVAKSPAVQAQTAASQLPAQSPAPAPAPGPAPAAAEQDDGEDVTYLPGEGDPRTTKWRGHTFVAGEPKRIKDRHHIMAARANKFFRVGKGGKPDDNPNRGPSTSEEYRAHVVEILNAGGESPMTVEDFIRKWAGERQMRDRCGVGDDDIRWLGGLVEPRLRQMRGREGLSDHQVADIWIKYGIFDIPWRAS